MQSELYQDVCQPHQGCVYTLVHSTTVARYQVPKAWFGQMITVTSQNADLYLAFGDSLVKVSATKYAQATGEVLAPSWASGILVPAGGMVSFPCAGDATHFSVVSSIASGVWSAYRSSGHPTPGERIPTLSNGSWEPALWLDFGLAHTVTNSSGIASVTDRATNRYTFSEATNKPAWNDAATVGSGLMRAAAGFTAGSSHKLVCTDANLAGIFDGTGAFTVVFPVRRGATGALHTLLSVATDGSANGHWDLTLNASDDIVYTRVDSAGASTASTYATTVNTTPILITLVYDGSAPALYVNRTVVSLSGGPATGDLGTASKVCLGARLINTSTYDQFATAEIPEVLAWNSALSTADLATVHGWLGRRYAL